MNTKKGYRYRKRKCLVRRKLRRARLGLKCRHKWHRRRGCYLHGGHPTDSVYNDLMRQCHKYYTLMEYLKNEKAEKGLPLSAGGSA